MNIDRDEFIESLEYWIEFSSRVLEKSANDLLSEHNITYRQVKVLGVLVVRGPISQTELADRVQVEPSTIVRVVDRMERDGWVNRQNDPTDKRRNIVVITEMASTIWGKVLGCAEKLHAKAFNGIEPERVESAIRTLSEICMNLSEDNPRLAGSKPATQDSPPVGS